VILDDRLPEFVPGAEFPVVEGVDGVAAVTHRRQSVVPLILLAGNRVDRGQEVSHFRGVD
jgi:hypothetical protein